MSTETGCSSNKLGAEFKADDDKRDDVNRGQHETDPTSNRKRVVITEYWGDILDIDAAIAHERCVCVLGNKRVILKNPTPYDYLPWVFVRPAPVPFGVYGRGLFDEAASLNKALNEFVSLIVDGAIASVWGIRQLRQDFLDDPNQVSDGIPQGETLVCGPNLPPGEKVLVQSARRPPERTGGL